MSSLFGAVSAALPYLLVGLGGALGATARYAVGVSVGARAGTAFPLATLLINVSGSVAIGLLAGILPERVAPGWRLLLVVGFLGGYTTFSAFALETVALVRRGEWVSGAVYVLLSNALALAGCAIGLWLAGVVSRGGQA